MGIYSWDLVSFSAPEPVRTPRPATPWLRGGRLLAQGARGYGQFAYCGKYFLGNFATTVCAGLTMLATVVSESWPTS